MSRGGDEVVVALRLVSELERVQASKNLEADGDLIERAIARHSEDVLPRFACFSNGDFIAGDYLDDLLSIRLCWLRLRTTLCA
jgi:hypothetical protein